MSEQQKNKNMPVLVELKKGETYRWCTCGKTKHKPFCDGVHGGEDATPLEFTAEKDRRAFLCTCRRTKNPPYCDNSHEGDISYIMSEISR